MAGPVQRRAPSPPIATSPSPWGRVLRELWSIFVIPLVLLATGTIGYVWLEGWSVFDALYMTVITLGTVGYAETHPLSEAGRVFTLTLILGGVFSVFYFGAAGVRFLADGELLRLWRSRKMQASLDQQSDHVIVCGFGRLGQRVCEDLARHRVRFVVIEAREDAFEGFALDGGLALHGDATSDAVLHRAGLTRARALITALSGDADNLYVALTARLASERLFIVARAETPEAEAKLVRAGASRVVSPYVVSGYRAAQAILRPDVLDFVDVASGSARLDLELEQTELQPGSRLVGKSLASARVRQEFGVMVIALKHASGEMLYNPPADLVFVAGDVLIVMGTPDQLAGVEAAARGADT